MSRNLKIAIGAIIIIALIIIISTNQKPKVTGPILVGVIAPMSGPGASLGEFAKNTVDMTVEKINKEGGVNGQPIQLVYEDDQCDPAKSVSAMQKLINVDRVKIVLETTCSSGVISSVPIATQNGVFVFSSFATSGNLKNVSPLFARTIPSEVGLSEALANYTISKGWKNIAIIQESSEYSEAMSLIFESILAKNNVQITKEKFDTKSTDLRTPLTKLKATNPDAIFLIPATPAAGEIILSNLRAMNWKVQMIGNPLFTVGTEVFAKNKDLLEGVVIAEQKAGPDTPEYLAFKNEYKTKFGKSFPYESYAQATRDMLYILKDGLKKYGNDPQKISAWVRTTKDYPGFSGSLTIGSDGDREGGHVIKIVKDGKAEIQNN
jgi:branched-chain amino acid transport system substrate-binding protein